MFPQTSFYAMVALMPALRPRQNNWTLAGLGLAGILQGPVNELVLPWILAGHMLAAWMVDGGPAAGRARLALENETKSSHGPAIR
jgi:hypothetical protein